MLRYCRIFSELISVAVVSYVTIMGTMKKALRDTQTLHAGCSKAKPKIFTPPQIPFLRWVTGWPKFNQLVTTFTYKPSLVKIDARNFKLSW